METTIIGTKLLIVEIKSYNCLSKVLKKKIQTPLSNETKLSLFILYLGPTIKTRIFSAGHAYILNL